MSGLTVVGLLAVAAVVTVIPRRGRRRLMTLQRPEQQTRSWAALVEWWSRRSSRQVALVAALVVGTALVAWQGPVAGALGAGYAAVGAGAVLRRRTLRRSAAARARATDAISGLACDLRAGLAPTTALGNALPAFLPGAGTEGPARDDVRWDTGGELAVVEQCTDDPDRGAAARRLTAAWRFAERTGAPMAGVLERLDNDLRAAERARALAEAQTAGARATALLLAALPAAGLGLGFAIGADPLHVLLHTPLGAVLALAAAALQLVGLVWSSRLARVPGFGTA